ncbi:MAG: DEAD/DEAH box helicase [Candidatus Woesearchaeota archaeon]
MLKDFQPRLYQQTIFAEAAKKNLLAVLPTGLGKTAIAFMLAALRLQQYPNLKVLLLAPTRPLIQQHHDTFLRHLDIAPKQFSMFTGFVAPEKRAELWKNSRAIFSTPQTIENDIITKRIDLKECCLIVFDEAHRAVGDYAYKFIAEQYNNAPFPRILALTASPGSDKETIRTVCSNLHIEAIEARDEADPDVSAYVKEVKIDWIPVVLPEEFKIIKKHLEDCFFSKLALLKEYLGHDVSAYNKVELLKLQSQLQAKIAGGDRDFDAMKGISSLAEALKVQHALDLLETQGLEQLKAYLTGLQEQAVSSKVKAVKNLVIDQNFLAALVHTGRCIEKKIDHPKLLFLKEFVKKEIEQYKDARIIIFTQFRESVMRIKAVLDSAGFSNKAFVGQAKKNNTGLSQKEQKDIITEFSNGGFNCLVSTSVGEEGLDIPEVDLVMFYEPIPSAIRTVQRRGRTGRNREGRVIVLMTKNTRDEAYRWVAHHKEKRMHRSIDSLKDILGNDPIFGQKKENTLLTFVEPGNVTIYVDHREKASALVKELISLGINIDLKTLEIGDYLLSDSVVVEYKRVPDFVDSIIDGRLLSQLKSMVSYKKPLLIIEGTEDLYSQRNIHPNAIRGMLSTITVSYRIPLLFTKNHKETAGLMFIIARREQDPDKKDFQMHQSKPLTLKEQQEYIASSLPGIGMSIARPLLLHFKSLKSIFNATVKELETVDFIGKKKAAKIREVLDEPYDASQ